MDLAIRNGHVVTAVGEFDADIGVADGRIVQVGGAVPAAAREIDAAGLLVLPGGVDIHTHLTSYPGGHLIDDFTIGTRAAAAGGVTTVCDFALQGEGEGLRPALERALEDGKQAVVDYAWHVILRDPNDRALAEIPEMAADGHTSLKVFMSVSRFNRRLGEYMQALRVAGRAGVLTAIHAEDEAMIAFLTRELLAAGKRDIRHFPDSRPPIVEEAAVRRAIAIAEVTEAPVYFVHLSSRGALSALADGRARGLPVYGETRPLYLHLTRDRFELPNGEGAKFVGHPPLRGAEDVTAVWDALRTGVLSTVCTDHLPTTLARKMEPGHTFATVPPGMANLETQMPMLYHDGVRTGRISLPKMVEALCTNPARIAGLAPRKGTIAPGADADIVVFDPRHTRTVRAPEMQSAADYDIFDGQAITGWPRLTISRGEVVFEDGNVVGQPGRGRLAPRSRFSML